MPQRNCLIIIVITSLIILFNIIMRQSVSIIPFVHTRHAKKCTILGKMVQKETIKSREKDEVDAFGAGLVQDEDWRTLLLTMLDHSIWSSNDQRKHHLWVKIQTDV